FLSTDSDLNAAQVDRRAVAIRKGLAGRCAIAGVAGERRFATGMSGRSPNRQDAIGEAVFVNVPFEQPKERQLRLEADELESRCIPRHCDGVGADVRADIES